MRSIRICILAFVILAFLTSCKGKETVTVPEGWENIRPPHDVCSLAEQGNIIWAGGSEGVYKIDRQSRKLLGKLELDIPLKYVKAIVSDNLDSLWIGHQNGLLKYTENNYYNYTKTDGLPDNRINTLTQDRDGSIWAGTWNGAAKKVGENWEVLTTEDGLIDNMVNTILQDSKGYIWFGSYTAPGGGLCCYKGDKWTYFSKENGLPHNNINALLEDNNGRIWAATGLSERGGAGVIEYNDEKWSLTKVIKKEDGLAGEKVRSLFQDNRGLIWLGSEYDGLTYKSGEYYKILTVRQGLVHNEVKAIIQDIDGNLWMGTRDGITFISKEALMEIK